MISTLTLLMTLMSSTASADDGKIPDWIQPGVKIVLTPVTGSGSIVMAVTADRKLFFCGAEPDSSSHTPIPGQCNVPITKPGFELPVQEFMKGQSGWVTDFKIFMKGLAGISVVVAPSLTNIMTGPSAYGVAAAQGVGAVWNPSPIQNIKDQAEMANNLSRVIEFGTERDCGVPTVPVANTYSNMKDNLVQRINHIVAKLVKQSSDLKTPSQGLSFALQGHSYISNADANQNGPQTEEDEVAAEMKDIAALRQKNIIAPAIAAGACHYKPIAASSDSPMIAQSAPAVSTAVVPATQPQDIDTQAKPGNPAAKLN